MLLGQADGESRSLPAPVEGCTRVKSRRPRIVWIPGNLTARSGCEGPSGCRLVDLERDDSGCSMTGRRTAIITAMALAVVAALGAVSTPTGACSCLKTTSGQLRPSI